MRCEIQWIDRKGDPTPDTNEAIGYARCTGYPVKENPAYKPEPSKWFPVCAEHLKRLPLDGHWEFSANPKRWPAETPHELEESK